MKVSGFTFIRNAVKYDYPVVEAITSVLPLCDEFIVMVGNSNDETMQLIEQINSPKIRIFHSVWDDNLREGGRVLAVETDKAFKKISPDSHWAFYIQADEVLHEQYHTTVKQAMQQHLNDQRVEGLLFDYIHFYGSYDYVGDSRRWYPNEIRIVRNLPGIQSYRDAQGFRINGRKLKVKKVNACIYHYGWVKPPEKQLEKQKAFHALWHDETWIKQHVTDEKEFDYSRIDALKKFEGAHPQVMQERINKTNWTFRFDPSKRKEKFTYRLLNWINRKTGLDLGRYKNYTLI
ncbi:MAG: glycosyltransferase family 2 protein [Flavobacteriales bacterium]